MILKPQSQLNQLFVMLSGPEAEFIAQQLHNFRLILRLDGLKDLTGGLSDLPPKAERIETFNTLQKNAQDALILLENKGRQSFQ